MNDQGKYGKGSCSFLRKLQIKVHVRMQLEHCVNSEQGEQSTVKSGARGTTMFHIKFQVKLKAPRRGRSKASGKVGHGTLQNTTPT